MADKKKLSPEEIREIVKGVVDKELPKMVEMVKALSK